MYIYYWDFFMFIILSPCSLPNGNEQFFYKILILCHFYTIGNIKSVILIQISGKYIHSINSRICNFAAS